MRIGYFELTNNLFLAPMAGVTDRPFRLLCRKLGAGMAVSEMVASNPQLWSSQKTQRRIDHQGEPTPVSVQIAGAEPHMLADAAKFNVDHGAQIIDINMGCPAKKVCNLLAGSALLKNELLVDRILQSVVKAAAVPVTLKIRTGWDINHRNGIRIAKIAEEAGIQLLAVHGRTRACGFAGDAEYDTIAAIKSTVRIPVLANGDINSPEKAAQVFRHTNVDGLMIGRGAQGNPWIFREIHYFLATGKKLTAPTPAECGVVLIEHLHHLYEFYGSFLGVRIARKHLSWYSKTHVNGSSFRAAVNCAQTPTEQLVLTQEFVESMSNNLATCYS